MFIPRHPVVENQFCSYTTSSGGTTGAGGVIAYAGSVVKLNSGATNQESEISKMIYDDSSEIPFGFLMQKVKEGYHSVHPTGFYMPGDLGSSDVIAQPTYSTAGAISGVKPSPAGVAHLGIWDTVHYTALGSGSGASSFVPSAAILPGAALYAANDEAKVTNTSNPANDATDLSTGDCVNTTVVARVVKGASIAKATANIANTTLYPIRIKLLI